MDLSFHGAAGDVTGSCHLLRAAGRNILVDCGLFQGSRRLSEENAQPFGFDPASIDFLLLTHAHLDHCGRIPLLVKRGFHGRIYTTAATVELTKLVLLDAAALQLEALHRNHNHGNGSGQAPEEPLYTADDVLKAMAQFTGRMEYGQAAELALGVRATFQDAGHILGSASILLEVESEGKVRRLVFSGDLGNRDKPILNPSVPAPAADFVIMESTYGDRNHKSHADSIAEFRQAVQTTLARGGNVIIPTFALERAQDLLYNLRDMMDAKLLAPQTPVFLDSPMAISATEIFRRHVECFNPTTAALLTAGEDPFALPHLSFARDAQASRAIANVSGAIIMAGSGMATGGRILHHLVNNLPDEKSSIIFVGYAGAGTPARQIIEGAHEIKIYGAVVPVRAQICTIGGFSAHAGHDDLLAWAQPSQAQRIFLVHGEPSAAAVLGRDLGTAGFKVEIPQLGQTVVLDGLQQGTETKTG